MDKTTERIKADTLKAAEGIGDEHRKNAYYHGHRDGATAEIERLQPIIDALAQFIARHEGGLLPDRFTYEKGVKAHEQWKGMGKGQYTGSAFTNPAQGITLGCISPEARELLDTIMEEWEKHYAGMKEMHGDDMPETTFYGFAYWLVRWSGLIQPANNNPTK